MLYTKFGLYPEDYEEMLAVNDGACWQCNEKKDYVLVVDHCHENGHVRGLLCHHCNGGTVGDDLERMKRRIAYIEDNTKPFMPDRREEEKHPDRPFAFGDDKRLVDHPLYGRYRDLARFGDRLHDQFRTFEGFLIWAEHSGWREGLFLRRKDMDRPVEPDNFEWVSEVGLARVADRGRKMISAWGEERPAQRWLNDPRVLVGSYALLTSRLTAGWEPERALSAPPNFRTSEVTALGETKTYAEWGRDPRCPVDGQTIRHRMERLGWTGEEAVLTQPFARVRRTGAGRSPGGRAGRKPSEQATAWGETKFLADWVADPRCVVPKNVLHMRLKAGWDHEKAMTTSVEEGKRMRGGNIPSGTVMYEAHGESKSMNAWSKDPRCGVSYPTLKKWVEEGASMEEALVRSQRR